MDPAPSSAAQPAADAALADLFATIEKNFQTTSLGEERWYILAIACLATGPDPESASQLYLHLIRQSPYSTSTARQALVRRLREALVKSICIIGVCKPIEAILAISQVEREEDRDYTCTRDNWQCDRANLDRGMEWYRKVYTRNANDTMGLFDAHKDFAWISSRITYGLYLSDRQVLDDLDTELVVLAAIMSQNLPLETRWHIRGTRRIGVSKADTQTLWETIKLVAAHFSVSLHKVPTVDDVEPDV